MNVHGPMEWRLRGEDLFYNPVEIFMAFLERTSAFLFEGVARVLWGLGARLVWWKGNGMKQSFNICDEQILIN